MKDSDIAGTAGLEVESERFGLELDKGTCKEGVRGSENIGSCGVATFGQI